MDYIKRKDVYEAEFFCRDLDVSQDNVVRAISVFVDYLDLKEFKFIYSEPKKFGRKSYDPKDMLKLHIYGYVRNIRSCRTLEYAAKDSTSFKWLLGELTPHYKTISNFKKDNIDSIKLVFKAFMEYCIEMGLADVELIAVDGTFFAAVNHNSKNYSAGKIKNCLKQSDKNILRHFDEMNKFDALEDLQFQNCEEVYDEEDDDNPPDLPIATNDRDFEKELAELEKKKEEYNSRLEAIKESGDSQISLTDPDSRMMQKPGSQRDVSYNIQIAVDEKNKLILLAYACSETNDKRQLHRIASATKDFYGVDKLAVIADKGYDNGEEYKKCYESGIETYVQMQSNERNAGTPFSSANFHYDEENDCFICPIGRKLPYRSSKKSGSKEYGHKSVCQGCPYLNQCATGNKKLYRSKTLNANQYYYDRQMEINRKNQDILSQRKCIVEHPFGTIKRNMNQGYFLTKGIKSVNGELTYTVLAYNIKRVFNILGIDRMIASIKAYFRGDLGKRVIFVQNYVFSLKSSLFFSYLNAKTA